MSALLRLTQTAGLEDLTGEPVVDATELDIDPDVADETDETIEAATEMLAASEDINSAVDEVESVGDYEGIVEKADASPDGLSEETAESVNVGVEHILSRLERLQPQIFEKKTRRGVITAFKTRTKAGNESLFATANDRKAAAKAGLEDLAEVKKTLKEKLDKLIAWMKKTWEDFKKRYIAATGRLKAEVKTLSETVGKLDDAQKPTEIVDKSAAGAFGFEGTLSAAVVKKVLEAHIASTTKYVGELAKDSADILKGLKEGIAAGKTAEELKSDLTGRYKDAVVKTEVLVGGGQVAVLAVNGDFTVKNVKITNIKAVAENKGPGPSKSELEAILTVVEKLLDETIKLASETKAIDSMGKEADTIIAAVKDAKQSGVFAFITKLMSANKAFSTSIENANLIAARAAIAFVSGAGKKFVAKKA